MSLPLFLASDRRQRFKEDTAALPRAVFHLGKACVDLIQHGVSKFKQPGSTRKVLFEVTATLEPRASRAKDSEV